MLKIEILSNVNALENFIKMAKTVLVTNKIPEFLTKTECDISCKTCEGPTNLECLECN
jgi:hypothetical protein